MTWWEPDRDRDGRGGWRGVLVTPAFLLVGALVTGGLAVALLIWAGTQLVAGVEMSRAPICAAGAGAQGSQGSQSSEVARDRDCLQVVPLKRESGRIGHKTLTHIWTVTPVNGGGQVVDVSFMGSRRLRHETARGPVDGLFWHGNLVAFRGVDGVVVPTDDYGWTAGLNPLPWAAFLAGVSVGAVASLRARRRAGVGWWSSRRVDSGSNALTTASWGLIAVSIATGIPLQIGLPWWVAGGILLVGVAAVVVLTRRGARRQQEAPPPRHLGLAS